uniref:Amorphous calcium carbonate binding protein 1 n=1 Tax=Pinctada fucata TaxID=50426 RepID=A6XBS1_PINFU|nr:amorphous calcium carbonate binding protein 1 [Pinctada fucata]
MRKTMEGFLSYSICFCVLFSAVVAKCDYPEAKLLKFLLDDYEKLVRPVPKDGNATVVSMGFSLNHIDDYDSDSMELKSNAWLSLKWNDPRLTWNKDGGPFGNVKALHLPPSDIWVPDVVLLNGLQPFQPQFPDRLTALVKDTGDIYLITPSVLETRCTPDKADGDKATCRFKFMSWTYDGGEVELDLGFGGLSFSEYKSTPGLTILGNSSNINSRFYDCCPEPYYDIEFNINIEHNDKDK